MIGLDTVSAKESAIFLGFREAEGPDSVPEGWEPIAYFGTRENDIAFVTEKEETVLHVKSLGSASALLKPVDVDIEEFPILVWRWKINRVVGMAIENQKGRNDSSARIRVIFGEGGEKIRPIPPEMKEFFESLGIKRTAREPPGFKIDYIWGNRFPIGEVLDYPGSRNHKVVIVESGNARTSRWVQEERNLMQDYREFFGTTPPGLAAVVVLTDTDDTNEGVEAWYGSISLRRD